MSILKTPIEYLKGVGSFRGDLLRKELNIHTFGDLAYYFPYRHIDRTKVDSIQMLTSANEYAQIVGVLISLEIIGERRSRRLVGQVRDKTGIIEVVWFQGINWVQKILSVGNMYRIFGRLSFFMGKAQMAHPEIENWQTATENVRTSLEPVYSTTEKLKARGLTGRSIGKLTSELYTKLSAVDFPENLSAGMKQKFNLINRYQALKQIHFPVSQNEYHHAVRRLKFEELFFAQLRINLVKVNRHKTSQGWKFDKVGDLFNSFYKNHLPFKLTNAQKRAIKEVRIDTGSGKHMNRLLQGDVGSGKTIVALMVMLLAADNGFQSVMMAPTEILARQHYQSLLELLHELPVNIRLLTGSTSLKEKRNIIAACGEGDVTILVGTHAVIEDKVMFKNLGFAIVDEQHKFGVAQRAQLWQKNSLPPHILVMTATPIPRTLALTAYGDLDYSVIDELPPGRKPVNTIIKRESKRPEVMDFIREQIGRGRQVYIIYPLIEESSKLDYENLMKGYEEVKSFFPEPQYWISMVHGKQTADLKETNMKRFVEHDTQIMVSTTVIEVGVNVPNATVMVIESAERFGLSQLHQLRGRVGRGADQSYCVLMPGPKVSREAMERLQIMVETNDGFKIAEKDLELRGPGDIEGTRQSGLLNFKLANLVDDKLMLEVIRKEVNDLLDSDAELEREEHIPIKKYLIAQQGKTIWSKIS